MHHARSGFLTEGQYVAVEAGPRIGRQCGLTQGTYRVNGTPMAVGPGTRLGPYEVIALIGEVAWARSGGRTTPGSSERMLPDAFASDPERLARFQREAQVLAALNHPNIAHVYGLEEADDTRALVMELVEGETLADRIARGRIPVDEAIARQITDALDSAHEKGIVHRDLKPANIKVRADGIVKVRDFGLAKALEPTASSGIHATASPTITSPAMMTGVGMLLGTAAYMSPEQAKGRAGGQSSGREWCAQPAMAAFIPGGSVVTLDQRPDQLCRHQRLR